MLLVAAALAHPGATSSSAGARDVIGHRIELVVGPEITLTYVAEVPERRVLSDAREEADYGKKLLSLLGDNVKLTWNGEALAATPRSVADPVKPADAGFLNFTVQMQATLPAEQGTLGVRNGNYPGEPGFFATAVTVDGGLIAEETSLLKVKAGRIRDNWHGAWVRDEKAREPWVEIRPASFFERGASPESLPLRMAGVERPGLPWWTHLVGVFALVGVAWLGRWFGRRARR